MGSMHLGIKSPILLILIVLAIGIEFVASAPLEINGYEFISENVKQVDVRNWITYIYSEDGSDQQFNVQIIEYDTKEDTDYYFNNKESIGNLEINGQIVFIEENNNYIFWRNGNILMIVRAVNHDLFSGIQDGSVDPSEIFESYGSGDFPLPLIEAYLEEYPSECTDEGCVSEEWSLKEKIKEDLKWFWNPPEDIKDSNYYVSSGGSCPDNEERFLKIQKHRFLTDEELEKLKEHCKTNSFYTIIGKEIPYNIKDCMDEIDNYLKDNDIIENDEEIFLDECLLRERFIEDHEGYDSGILELLFNERNKIILRDIEFQQERREEYENSDSYKEMQARIEESLDERRKKRDEKLSDDSPNEITGQIVNNGDNEATDTKTEENSKEQPTESDDEKKNIYAPFSKRVWNMILSWFR